MKCSMHAGKAYSVKHNERDFDKEKWNNDGHIDYSRSELNQTYLSQPLYEFFDEQFGDALVEYNDRSREKHPERLIGFSSAQDYDKCPLEERRQRAVKAYYREQKNKVQEVIIQLGNHEDYISLVEKVGQERADQIHTDYLKEAFERWKKENSSLVPFCAVSHFDETRDGTPHIHIDFIPIAESNRGLSRKVSMDGALNQIGFKRKKQHKYAETPYKQWLCAYRASQEQAAQQFVDRNELGLTIERSEPTKSRHEQPQDYKLRQAEQKRKDVEKKTEELQERETHLQQQALEYEFEPKGKFERESHYNARRELHEVKVGLKHVEKTQALRERLIASERKKFEKYKNQEEQKLSEKAEQLFLIEENLDEEIETRAEIIAWKIAKEKQKESEEEAEKLLANNEYLDKRVKTLETELSLERSERYEYITSKPTSESLLNNRIDDKWHLYKDKLRGDYVIFSSFRGDLLGSIEARLDNADDFQNYDNIDPPQLHRSRGR